MVYGLDTYPGIDKYLTKRQSLYLLIITQIMFKMERILRRIAGRFGIRLAPLKIPIERRLQTFAVLFYLNCVFMIPFFGFLLLFIGLFTPFWILSVGYVFWMVYDMKIAKTPQRGGRRSLWLRDGRMARWARDYFPITLIKTADLDTSRNYMLATHPHGIFAMGTFDNFASEATGFGQKFPGIRCHLCTLTQNLWLPFVRGFLMWMG